MRGIQEKVKRTGFRDISDGQVQFLLEDSTLYLNEFCKALSGADLYQIMPEAAILHEMPPYFVPRYGVTLKTCSFVVLPITNHGSSSPSRPPITCRINDV